MKLLRLTTLLCACAALAACVSTPQRNPPPASPMNPAKPAAPAPAPPISEAQRRAEFDKSLARWHGADIKELRTKLGPPTSTRRQPDGQTSHVYAKTRTLQGPTGPYSFACTVGYVLDKAGQRVSTHWFEGC